MGSWEKVLGCILTIATPIAYIIYLFFSGFGWKSLLFHLVVFIFGILFWRGVSDG